MSLVGIDAALQMESVLPFASGITLKDVYLGILRSDTVARALAGRFDLKDYYRQPNMVKTMRKLRSHSQIVPDRQGLLETKVEDKDPGMATKLANAYIEELDRVFRSTRSSAGKRERVFLENRLLEAEAELDSAEAALAEVQVEKGVTALSRDLSEAALAAGELLGRQLALRVQIDMLDKIGAEESQMRKALAVQLGAVEAEASRLPFLGQDVAQKLRDLRIVEILYETLHQQLEAARIEEVRDTPAVEVLDTAEMPDRHVRPRRGLASIAGALTGFALGFGWLAFRHPQAG
jgi:uncharacterized protein involved in exopolysaccharide biosynthesis